MDPKILQMELKHFFREWTIDLKHFLENEQYVAQRPHMYTDDDGSIREAEA